MAGQETGMIMKRDAGVGQGVQGRGWPTGAALLAVSAAMLMPLSAQAQLFGDNEARRAILDLRQRYQTLTDEQARTRSSLLELQNQIESLRSELAKSRGREEQLARDMAEMQQRQKDLARAVEERSSASRPAAAAASNGDEAEAGAGGKEKAEFDAALNHFRKGDYAKAQTAFRAFVRNRPQSSMKTSALFWLGNSDYALRSYRSAMANFRAVVAQAPDHERAPEALLSIANCQTELKETTAARATLEQLVAKYPRTEAAQAARDRLARLK